jgi:UDP-N-acetylglucosamine diphosphorylase / glucose-1-phosphate thymidylyltransferase / UDP-N-acetylgalactosamine diphosphorylase / glucosamine-1-phosphate N-acetyltransferase / galactosamine-1-phosphate N-acetyltransferase
VSQAAPIVLWDDNLAREFAPFAMSRPLCEVRAGGLLIRERWLAALGRRNEAACFVSRAELSEFAEPGSAANAPDVLPAGTIVVNSRALPLLPAAVDAADAVVWMIGDRVAAVRLLAPTSRSLLHGDLAALSSPTTGHAAQLSGYWLNAVWDLIGSLADLLTADIAWAGSAMELVRRANGDDGVLTVGSHPVFCHPTAKIEPGAMLDTSAGPILLEAGATVQAFTRLVGPSWIGVASSVTGSRVTTVAIGPQCRVSGEMSHVIMFGFANKGHDGFVGHSVLGRWVNLGAGTITSNLKNTYGPVALWTPAGVQDTGLQFLGTFFGDHAKTGIGVRLTTGCVIGAGANCFDAMPPKVVEPFAWGSGAPYGAHAFDKFLETAERMMARRSQSLDTRGRMHWAAVHRAQTTTPGS